MTDSELAPNFDALVASRKAWIAEVLKPWCRVAPRNALRMAELEWGDIAGRVSPEKSLWAWAWGRFPELVHPELNGIDESSAVTVTLKNGRQVTGYPDARQSEQGQLVILCRNPASGRTASEGPFPMEEIASIARSQPRS